MRLTEAHDRYQELYDFAPVGYFVLDQDWHITEANTTAEALLGVERDKLLHKRITRYLTETECDSFHWYARRMKEDALAPPFEDWFRRANGELLRGMLKVQPIKSGFRMALLDMTDKRSAEDQLCRKNIELAETSHRISQIAKTIGDVFYRLEVGTGTLVHLSGALEQVFARSEDEVRRPAQGWLAFVHEDDVPTVLAARSGIEGGNQPSFDMEYRIARPDGTTRSIRDRGFLDAVHGQVVGVLHDSTRERRPGEGSP